MRRCYPRSESSSRSREGEAMINAQKLRGLIADAANELDRLIAIEKAARNLIAQKGRYNTEIAYKLLESTLKATP